MPPSDTRVRFVAIAAAVFCVSAWFLFGQTGDPAEVRLWHYRNLGKALYENPTTQKEAVEQFKKALDLAPDSR